MRKVFVWVSVVLLVAVLAMPASALGGSTGASPTLRFSPIQFDSIEIEYGSRLYEFPYPFNSGYTGSSGEFEYDGGAVYGDMSVSLVEGYNSYPAMNGSLLLPLASPSDGNTANISLSSDNQILDSRFIDDFVFSFDVQSLNVRSVVVSGGYNTVDLSEVDSNYYASSLQNFRFECDIINGRIQIGKGLKDYFTSVSPDDWYWFISYLRVDIEFARRDVNTTRFEVSATFRGEPNFSNWLYEQKLTTPEFARVEFDVTDWLRNTVGGFLDFELFPGFSINTIFYLILVIGVLLWFITLLI